ncbi:26385_t:CDS:2, partial [Racocetra persica]
NEKGEASINMDSDNNHISESTTPSTTGQYSTSSKNKRKDPDRSNEELKKSESDNETRGFKIAPRNHFRNKINDQRTCPP